MTTALALNSSEARALTDQIKTGVEAVWHLITRAYTERAWSALGYQSWDDYCTREFGTSRLRLPREERAEVVSSLRDSGLSLRAIASATGLGRGTVERELSPVPNGTPGLDSVECDGKCATDECICPVDDEDALADELSGVHVADAPLDIPEQQLPPLPENYMTTPPSSPATRPVTGVDGKSYPARQPSPPRRRAITDTARDLGLDIEKIAKRIEEFGADDRIVRNKNEVAPRLRNHLERVITVCQDLNQQLT